MMIAVMTSSRIARIGVWNSEWAGPRSPRRKRIIRKLADLNTGILCVNEGYRDLLPQNGNSDPDCGYPIIKGRRKVLLWSRHDWILVDRVGSLTMPGGRFVSGVTETPASSLTVLGVCIPWRMAHVSTGSQDRKSWEDHLAYLEGLREVLLQNQGQLWWSGISTRPSREGHSRNASIERSS
jgi:hypothetical protein